MTTKFVYIGRGGEHHSGIPARDLTEEDWAGLTSEQKQTVTHSPLYKAVTKPTVKKDGVK